jgi:hypothetical protein
VSEPPMKSSLFTRRTLLLAATLPAAARVFAQAAPATYSGAKAE